jgi:hypothetical protein
LDARLQHRRAQQKLELRCDLTQVSEMADAKRVLIVDDDTAVLRIMREALQNLLQWEVDTSPSPE